MASIATESSPLLPPPTPTLTNPPPARPQRTVAFNPQTTINNSDSATATTSPLRPAPPLQHGNPVLQHGSSTPPVLSTLNSKLRRRNSHGAPLSTPTFSQTASKIGPQRTTKNAQKLKLLPNPDPGDEGSDEESGRDVYSQFTRIKDPTARRDAARLGKADRGKLPRVTAYCTASAYRLEGLMKFLKGRARKTRGTNPKQFDECLYSPYSYSQSKKSPMASDVDAAVLDVPEDVETLRPNRERRFSDSAVEVEANRQQTREELIDLSTEAGDTAAMLENGADSSLPDRNFSSLDSPHTPRPDTLDFDTQVHTPEVFLFEYGTVVIWGMTPSEETRFLSEISKFETEKLSPDDVQVENFNFYYTREYQARIYNDFISLREKRNYMTKLAISHALSQSVKTSLFEDLLSTTIALTHPLPAQLALTGSIALTRRQIIMQIGQLFILRINIHLQGSVLDSPELMWAEPQLEPVYGAVRSYLEMDQRVGLLTERLDVIADLLAVLKDQVGTKHGEYLEWIVIVLIAAEILVAAINIVVDLYAGVD
ncbi:MAG: hypothetical protein Q9191_000946 [Dirinaria sp. TL-2023a]